MPLLSYDPMEDGQAANANLWNIRLSAIHDLLNGNLDAANLANGAVTTPKLADEAVTSPKIGAAAILPSHMNNVWVGKSTSKSDIGTSWFTVFDKTVELSEAAYIYVLWTTKGNANKTGDPGVQVLVNDVALTSFTGAGGLELYEAKLNADFPFAMSGITDEKESGVVNVKIQVKHSASAGWDVSAGFVRIDALGDDTYLG